MAGGEDNGYFYPRFRLLEKPAHCTSKMQCEHPLSHFPLNELSASVGVEGFGYFNHLMLGLQVRVLPADLNPWIDSDVAQLDRA
jgi:hypothetical protein